jgi:sulfur carrier protein
MPASDTLPDMRVDLIVNGEAAQARAATLAALLDELGYGALEVATAVNGDFVPKRLRTVTALAAGDRIEIVAPRQGG